MVRRGRFRWFGHLECKDVDDWVSACRNVVMAGVRCMAGAGRLGVGECFRVEMKLLGLRPELVVVFRVIWRDFIHGANI